MSGQVENEGPLSAIARHVTGNTQKSEDGVGHLTVRISRATKRRPTAPHEYRPGRLRWYDRPVKKAQPTRSRKIGDAAAMDILERAAAQYEDYLRLTELTTLESLARPKTWQHDPNAPLSVHLIFKR